jgi:lipopolysaccharide/colanic/teichoic acid biosynthesis glycosyltransferase
MTMTAAMPGYSVVHSSAHVTAPGSAQAESAAAGTVKAEKADKAPSESWLMAWAAGRSGFSCVLAIGRERAAVVEGTPQYAVHLAAPIPVSAVIKALGILRKQSASTAAVLLIAPRGRGRAYREHLRLNSDQHVVSIHRNFRKGGPARSGETVLGVAWKIGGALANIKEPVEGRCWRSVKTILRTGAKDVTRELFPRPARIEDARSDLVGQLTPSSLKALAEHLGYREVRDFCFAAPDARIADDAFLRGPLFISTDAITGEHVHVGPGWVTGRSAPVTLPSRPELMDVDTEPVRAQYFVGPGTREQRGYDRLKRMIDVPFALAAIFATLPICILAALIIKLYDRGPVFFVHKRESLHGKPFGCLKFRTMVRDAEALKKKLRESSNQVDGPQFKMAYDPRITPIGRFLRKTNIDELPQFLNVLVGDMSVVGPRPSPFEENQLCPAWREARLSVKPGITGLWQVSRSRERGAADFQEWIFYDTQYVERRSIFLDIKIILLTIKELFGKGQ